MSEDTIEDLVEELAREFRVHQQLYSEMDEGQQRMAAPGLMIQSRILDLYQLKTNVVRQFKIIEPERKSS